LEVGIHQVFTVLAAYREDWLEGLGRTSWDAGCQVVFGPDMSGPCARVEDAEDLRHHGRPVTNDNPYVVDTPPSPEVAAQIEAGRQKLDAMTSKQQSNDTPDGRAPHRMSEAAKSAKAAMNAPPLVKEVNPAASPAEQAITRLRNDPASSIRKPRTIPKS
jgi:hypothetical protein